MLHLVLLIVAIVCFAFAAFGVTFLPKVSLGWLGAMFFAISFLV